MENLLTNPLWIIFCVFLTAFIISKLLYKYWKQKTENSKEKIDEVKKDLNEIEEELEQSKRIKTMVELEKLVIKNNQKKWVLIIAEYRNKLYIVDEMQCLGEGKIYPTKFKNFDFAPDSEHIKSVDMVVFDSEDDFNSYQDFMRLMGENI